MSLNTEPATKKTQPKPTANGPTSHKRRGGPPDETKRQKFRRICSARTIKVLKQLDLLINIGRNRSAYDYTNEDVEKIFTKLQEKVDSAKTLMSRPEADPDRNQFHL